MKLIKKFIRFLFSHFWDIIGRIVLFIIIYFIVSLILENEEEEPIYHENYNMVHIDTTHVYEKDTKIVYIESGVYTYTVYLSPDGNPYRYNTETKEMEEITNKEE